MSKLIGETVIVRDHRAGVHVGVLEAFDAATKSATLTNARKVWEWIGAASCHGLATRGLKYEGSKVCGVVAVVELLDVVEVVSCSSAARNNLYEAPEWIP